MPNAKIFVFAPETTGKVGDTLEKLQDKGCEIVLGNADWHTPKGNNESEMCRLAAGADALMGTSIRSSPISRTVMESSDNLRIVAKYTVGVDDVDIEAATSLGILVTHSPTEANWGGVAEGTITMMLTMLKKVRERDESMKAGNWRDLKLQGTFVGYRFQDEYPGITIGLIGLGRIGRRVAELLKPWRVRILACDPYVERARFTIHGVVQADLDTVLRESDVVSMHVTLNDSSRRMMNAENFAKMKPSAYFINTSRGGAVDEQALIDALKRDVIAGAALDVFEDEPLAKESELRKLGHKVLLSAHMVTSNLNSGIKPGAIWAAECVERALKGEVPDNIINPEVLPRWEQRFRRKALIE
ncbi:MAG: D-3-phosphoglycerate dehydrogenase [Pseudomonadota bacterium]|jgi:phosphoglycerate dehydrogenase-like enzyme